MTQLLYNSLNYFNYSITQLLNNTITQLLNYSITQLLNYSITHIYSITQLLNYSITRLLNYSITRLLNYSITRLLNYLNSSCLAKHYNFLLLWCIAISTNQFYYRVYSIKLKGGCQYSECVTEQKHLMFVCTCRIF